MKQNVKWAVSKNGERPFLHNCAVLEMTADGYSVGRCWHYAPGGKCPRHGDVTAIQKHYAETGLLTRSDGIALSEEDL